MRRKPVHLGGAMYRKQDRQQGQFESFHMAFGGKLRSDNRWVRLAKLVRCVDGWSQRLTPLLLAHATGMVHFRTRLDAAGLAEINERITERADVADRQAAALYRT